MPAFYTLPDRPNLQYMRKEAKSLLRRLRAGDREALEHACARHWPLANTPHTACKASRRGGFAAIGEARPC